MIGRRQVMLGGSFSIIWNISTPCSCNAQEERHDEILGCTLSDIEADNIISSSTEARLYATGNEPMIPKSGDKDFDIALAHTLSKISETFGVLPGFAYYDDYDGKNAYATPRVRLSRSDGTVLFGQNLLKQLRKGSDHPELGVAAVCAHEFGHILQYKHGLARLVGAGQKTVKRIELQADFFAGFFAGVRKKEKRSYPAAVFAQTQYNAGDNMINHQDHHGTPEERANAIVKGFKYSFEDNRSLGDAISFSTNYVSTL